jgi:hypothetical protein
MTVISFVPQFKSGPMLKYGRQKRSERGEGKEREDVRAGFVSSNLIIETEIIVITNASHALGISEEFSSMFDMKKGGKETRERKVNVQSRPNQRQYK